MKWTLILSLLFFCFVTRGQQNYASLTRDALETMWKAKENVGYQEALDKYESAFQQYPDSIDGGGLYKASVLAAQLQQREKAFLYLTRLVGMKTDEYGYPTWRYVAGKYAESEYKNLLGDTKWQVLKEQAITDRDKFYQDLRVNEEEFFSTKDDNFLHKDEIELYAAIRNHQPYLPKRNRSYSVSFSINDSVKTAYLVHLPENYDPEKKYPLLFFLHGAVRNNALVEYQVAKTNLGDWNRYYTKYAAENKVILVFPKGSRQYNWMTPDDGFFMIPEMLKQIKKAINVDDDKVFISGHSNGATGSFSYMMKQASPFAGFYGFNAYPKVFTGGTFIENIKNRSFINFSTDEDYYYPPQANDTLVQVMRSIKADYKDYRYNGFPHWFPQFDESEPAYQVLFQDLLKRERNPFPSQISWELDDETYGAVDWLTTIQLDTLQAKKKWQQTINFNINKWLRYNDKDSLIMETVDRDAFDFPRKSGRVKAVYRNNIFRIETSCIKALTINISPEMVDVNKKIKVYVNGKLYVNKKITYDRSFMLQCFENSADRVQLWVNDLRIQL